MTIDDSRRRKRDRGIVGFDEETCDEEISCDEVACDEVTYDKV